VLVGAILGGSSASHATSVVVVGDQTVEPKTDSNTAGLAEAFQTTATGTGSVATLSVYVDASSTASSVVAGIYTDKSGHPGTLLGQGTLNAPTKGAWNTISLDGAAVTSGTPYWIALLGPGGTLAFRDRCCGGGTAAETSSQKTLQTLPATWTTGKGFKDGPFSVYGSTAATPVLVVSPSTLTFAASVGGPNPQSQTFGISNGGGGALSWTATPSSSGWLSLDQSSGSGPATVTAKVDSSGLSAGTYPGSVTVDAPGAQSTPQTVTVTLTVSAPDTQAPTTPTNLAANVSGSTVALSWNASTDDVGVAHYDVYRSTTPGFTPSQSNRIGQAPTASYADTNVAPGTYYYAVAAEDAAGNVSAPSTQVSATVTAAGPPVYLAGDQAIEGNGDFNSAGVAEAFKTTAAATGTVAKITVYIDAGSTATTIDVGLYADNGGHPGALLTQGTLNAPPSATWDDVPVPAAQVTSGQSYWIALLGPSGSGTIHFRSHGTGGAVAETSSQSNLLTLPSSWSTGSPNHDGPFSAWAAGAGPAGPPPDQVGQWSAPTAWPIVAVHMSMLPNGNILMFDAWSDAPNSQHIWNPTTGQFVAVPDSTNLFCAGHILLPDGRTLIVGGNVQADEGIKDATLFNASTNTWSKAAPMTVARWYPTATVLGSGKVFVFAGDDIVDFGLPYSPTYFKEASQSSLPEVYDPATNTWQDLTSSKLTTPLYPYMFQLSDGRILDAGPDVTTRVIDPSNNWSWSVIGTSPFDGGSAVMYLPDKIMKAGSYANPDYYGSAAYNTSAQTAVLDMTQSNPQWRSTAPMSYPRSYGNLTLLPDGTVLASGGETSSDGTDLSKAVLPAEIWNPTTETWTTVASLTTGREYHSTAILLPDGRVLMAGGGQLPGRATNIYSGEIYSPPYLFKGNRPTITSAPSTIQYGSQFTVATPDASSIQKVALIRTPSVTHAFDQNQRYIPLSFTQGSGQLTVQAPSNPNTAPPGYYMLWILNGNGVPSVASFVRFPAPYEDTQAPTAPTGLAATGGAGTASLQWNASTDNVGVTVYDVYRSTTSGFTPSPQNKIAQTQSTSYTDAGLAVGTYYYVVKAEDAAGNLSGASNQATAVVTSSDVTPPSVSITAPTAGATVSSTITLTASASDNVGVTSVQFMLDGNALGAPLTAAPYSEPWDTSTVTNGGHTLTAVARDAAGNATTSSPIGITVNNTTPPPSVYLFGDQTIEPVVDFNAAGLAEAFKTSSTTTGTLRKVTLYVDSSSTATKLVVGVYTDNGGHPGTLLASGSISSPTAGAWNDVQLSSSAPVATGTTYWIAVLSPSGSGQVKFREHSGGTAETSSQTTLSTLPATWTSGHAYGDGPISGYASGSIP